MKVIVKIEEYLRTHKTPVTTDELAKRFAVAKATVQVALGQLQGENVAKKIKLGNKVFWQYARLELPVAVPTKPAAAPTGAAPQPTDVRTSYPHVRGYED